MSQKHHPVSHVGDAAVQIVSALIASGQLAYSPALIAQAHQDIANALKDQEELTKQQNRENRRAINGLL